MISSSSWRGGELGVGERADDGRRQAGLDELDRREVDRDPDILGPFRRFEAGGAQHPFADREDQAGFLGERHEQAGRDHAAGRMVPADQRLEAGQLLGLGVDHRLILELELAARDRLPEVGLEDLPVLRLGVHFGGEEAIGAAARRLGRIESEVGVADQRVGAVAARAARCAMPTEAPIEMLWPSII